MKYTLLTLLLAAAVGVQARNTVETVGQVTETVSLTTDVDYVITSTEPFATTGSVDIVGTDRAVVIFKKIKPSQVVANQLTHVFINGAPAVDSLNCLVRAYDRGAIVYAYGQDFHPLTCYTEENFGGTSYDAYTEGHSGGYMKTLSKAQLNNQIRSFRLRRGFMVTFAIGQSGWGYSRCFIADQEDLEIAAVPAPMNGKITSYRLFRWWNTHKAGLASNGDPVANAAVGSSWCYDWGTGNENLRNDVEWVPNHIYEDWPSSSACGSRRGSCHMKTNNEPGNKSDDHPQEVDVILNNWQNLMRTGMRLCSESSHDGSWNHFRAFIDSIDARGWRCDLLDLHCYWAAGSFGDFSNYYNNYGHRPIWISEWMWGASWNSGNWSSGGIFAQAPDGKDSGSQKNQECMKNGTVPILEKLNASKYVERYAFWNSEATASKIYKDGKLTLLGQYYAAMDEGMGYDASIQNVPKIVYHAPSALTSTYTKAKGTMELAWTDTNYDMLDSIVVEVKRPGTSRWTALATFAPQDQKGKDAAAYTYTDKPTAAGMHTYRVVEYVGATKKYTTDEATCTVSAATAVGLVQYGQLKIGDDQDVSTDLVEQPVAPYAVMGMVSNNNTANGIASQVRTLGKSSFKFRFQPWTLDAPVSFDKAETIDYLLLPADTVYHLTPSFMLISAKAGNVKGDEVHVVFPEAFPEGVTPVVVAQQNTSLNAAPVVPKVYDVTNTGFSIKLVRQEGITTSFSAQNVNYFAATPGQVSLGGGKLLTVGRNEQTRVGGSSRQSVAIVSTEGDTLHLLNPTIIAAPQTHNYAKASVFRLHSTTKTDAGTYMMSIRRQVDPTSTVTEANSAAKNGDYVGWLIVSDDPTATGDEPAVITPTAIEGIQQAGGHTHQTYDLQGRHATQPRKGLYIMDGRKVVVK